ncbi:MAG TPA: FAD-dependent oxidoreductase, partial [Bauldia sp.]|nr:FAD-dependent oxidoreductase [Bauldia sp.]
MSGHGIVIIGGGHGGSQAAATLRAEGYDGRVTLVSAEVEVPYQRPPLSKAFLKDPTHALLPLRPQSFYEKQNIDLRLLTEARAIDLAAGEVRLDDGSALPFDGLVLATGARPRIPPIAGASLDGVLPLRTAEDARRIRDRLHGATDVVVVGGGFIGLEIAG